MTAYAIIPPTTAVNQLMTRATSCLALLAAMLTWGKVERVDLTENGVLSAEP
jgi:hypothetical protein